jgi:WD40 repeat protein
VILQQVAGVDGAVLTAVPLQGSEQPVSLLAFAAGADWDVRPNGSAIAIALGRGLGTTRIATWDARTGATRWVTPDEPGVLHGSPIWSADGRSIFFSAIRPPDDLGIFRVSASGGTPSRIRAPEGFGGRLEGLTPDGRGLVWGRNQAGSSTEVFDLASGRDRSYPEGNSSGVRWRSQQPRALLVVGRCCVGNRGTLVVWDDLTGEQRKIYGSELTPQEAVGSADWEPDGTRIVVSVFDTTTNSTMALVTMDEFGRARSPLPGTEGAVDVRWLDSGIVYFKLTEAGDGDMILLPPGGGPQALLHVVYPSAWKVVAP